MLDFNQAGEAQSLIKEAYMYKKPKPKPKPKTNT